MNNICNSKLEELYEYIVKFKEEFAEIEGLNPNYIDIHITDENNVILIPTNENSCIFEGYRF